MQTTHAKNWAIAIVLGILGTIQYHLAQFTSRFDIVFGDRGDVRGIVYFCEHWYRWLIGKADLMSPGIFYPTKHTLAYSDFLVGYAIPYAIARWLGFGMFSSMEIVVILFTFLNYLACYLLLKHVLNFKLLPACAAAMFFAFSSPKFHQLPHLQLQYVVLLPLIFACIILFVRKSQTLSQREAAGWLSAAVLLFILQAATAFYYAWFFVLWTLLFLIISLALKPTRRLIFALTQKYWRAAVAASVVLLLGFAFVVLSYLPGLRGGQWYKYDFVSQMIPSWWSLIWMGEGNYLWGWTSAAVLPEPRPSTWGELRAGFGLVPTIAWIVSIVWFVWRMRSRKGDRTLADAGQMFLAAAILTTTLFFLIGLKYGSHSPWFFIYQYFPGGKAIRAVARYVIFLSLPMAIAFAFLMDRALDWAAKQEIKKARAVTVAIVLIATFGVLEQFGVFKVGGTGFSKKVEEAYLQSMAGKLPGGCNAFYVAPGANTHSTAEYHYDAMLISIISGVPTLNASSSQFPAGWDLYFVNDPNYETNVKRWIELSGIKGTVCRLEIDPQVEAFDMNAPTPLNDDSLFVRQQFRDFAGGDTATAEVERYAKELQTCKTTNACDAAAVSFKIFRDTGFLDDGSFLVRVYQVGLARAPKYDEFTSDLNAFRGEKKERQRFIEDFVGRPEFATRYSSMSSRDFVSKLIDNARINISSEARRDLESGTKSPAQLLLELTDNPDVSRQLGNNAFVTLLYFGYLRRDPDRDGFANWQEFLQRTGDLQPLVSKFISSVEYRRRFASSTQ